MLRAIALKALALRGVALARTEQAQGLGGEEAPSMEEKELHWN